MRQLRQWQKSIVVATRQEMSRQKCLVNLMPHVGYPRNVLRTPHAGVFPRLPGGRKDISWGGSRCLCRSLSPLLLSLDTYLTFSFFLIPSVYTSQLYHTHHRLIIQGQTPSLVKMEMNYDDAELHRIEEELHMEILPGTEVCCILDHISGISLT